MTVHTTDSPSVQQTEHPHIVLVPGICGGRPIIKGTRISVRHVAQRYKAGDSVDDILQAHPYLTGAAVHDAISYYLDHQADIDQEILENRLEALAQIHNFSVDEQGRIQFDPSLD